MIDWTLAHLRLMWAFVGLTFLVMLFIPDARWNAITTVWGALFLGLLISLVLEQRGEGIQRRVWLAQNTGRARTTVDELLAVAAQSAAFAVDLPTEIMQALISGATRSARREAAERARAHSWSRMQPTPVNEDNGQMPADDVLEYARLAREVREGLPDLRRCASGNDRRNRRAGIRDKRARTAFAALRGLHGARPFSFAAGTPTAAANSRTPH